jgi:GNAT superfamily N-acetyltransferase
MVKVEQIRDEDREAWECLYLAYADFYQFPISAGVLNAVWSWIFDERRSFYCVVARNEAGEVIGFAHYKAILSPLRGTEVGFLDDLYVDPRHRGKGAVDALFAELKQACRKNGWPSMRWNTRDNNYRARSVYDKYATKTDWLTYNLDATDDA